MKTYFGEDPVYKEPLLPGLGCGRSGPRYSRDSMAPILASIWSPRSAKAATAPFSASATHRARGFRSPISIRSAPPRPAIPGSGPIPVIWGQRSRRGRIQLRRPMTAGSIPPARSAVVLSGAIRLASSWVQSSLSRSMAKQINVHA